MINWGPSRHWDITQHAKEMSEQATERHGGTLKTYCEENGASLNRPHPVGLLLDGIPEKAKWRLEIRGCWVGSGEGRAAQRTGGLGKGSG